MSQARRTGRCRSFWSVAMRKRTLMVGCENLSVKLGFTVSKNGQLLLSAHEPAR